MRLQMLRASPEQRWSKRGKPAPFSLPSFQSTGWGQGGGQIRQTLQLVPPCYGRSLMGSSSYLSEESSKEPEHWSPNAGFRSSCTAPTAMWLLLSHLAFQTAGVAPINGVVTAIKGQSS